LISVRTPKPTHACVTFPLSARTIWPGSRAKPLKNFLANEESKGQRSGCNRCGHQRVQGAGVMEQPIRFWRLQGMVFGPRELETKLEAMTSPTPAKTQHAGFTGVRVMVRLRDVARTGVPPEPGAQVRRMKAVM
jgi:hypothetical protein